MNLKNFSTHLFSFSRVLVLGYLFLSPWNDVCVHPIKSCCSPWRVLQKLQVARLVARNPGKHLVGAVILRTHFGFCHLALLSVLARVPSRSISWVGLLCAVFPAPCRLSYVPPWPSPCWRSQDSDGGASACWRVPRVCSTLLFLTLFKFRLSWPQQSTSKG